MKYRLKKFGAAPYIKWRIVDNDTNVIARDENQKPLDGGGYENKIKAIKKQTELNSKA